MSHDLARRAVACAQWRWLPGMLAVHPNFRDVRVSHVGLTGMHGACRYASPMGGVSRAVVALPLPTPSNVLPDLTDDLTRLGLITLVQEAHPECRIDLCDDMARVIRAGGEAGNITDGWLPTAEALVKALEAAP